MIITHVVVYLICFIAVIASRRVFALEYSKNPLTNRQSVISRQEFIDLTT